MREIKFKYICKDVTGDIFTFITTIEELEKARLNIDTFGRIEEILARNEYTQLKDKNGREIYEGDIVKFQTKEWDIQGEFSRPFVQKKVKFVDGSFYADGMYEEDCFEIGWNEVEVIGNIYENPELLKEEPR